MKKMRMQKVMAVPDPALRLNECGISKEMALWLYYPALIVELLEKKTAKSLKSAVKMVDLRHPVIWNILDKILRKQMLIVRYITKFNEENICAFYPVLRESDVIYLNPYVEEIYSFEFSGEEVEIYAPVTQKAIKECREYLLPELHPWEMNGDLKGWIEFSTGCYNLTRDSQDKEAAPRCFKDINELELACENHYITLQTIVNVRTVKENPEGMKERIIWQTTAGRAIFNSVIPQDLGLKKTRFKGHEKEPEINYEVDRYELEKLINRIQEIHGADVVVEVLENLKKIVPGYMTRMGLTISSADLMPPEEKKKWLEEAEKHAENNIKNYRRGLLTKQDLKNEQINIWADAQRKINERADMMYYDNEMFRRLCGSWVQERYVKCLSGMIGLSTDHLGHTREFAIKSSFTEGLKLLEYSIYAVNARHANLMNEQKMDQVLVMAEKLKKILSDIVVTEEDCQEDSGEVPGKYVHALQWSYANNKLSDCIKGRVSCEDIKDAAGNVIVHENELITAKKADEIEEKGCGAKGGKIKEVKIRTAGTCRCKNGICAKCYGTDPFTGEFVKTGRHVGNLAAQMILRKLRQLTSWHSRYFDEEINGLKDVSHILEAEKVKEPAVLAEEDAKVIYATDRYISTLGETTGKPKVYFPLRRDQMVRIYGNKIYKGEQLTCSRRRSYDCGVPDLEDVLTYRGMDGFYEYTINTLKGVFLWSGCQIDQKHFELIVRQMVKNYNRLGRIQGLTELCNENEEWTEVDQG